MHAQTQWRTFLREAPAFPAGISSPGMRVLHVHFTEDVCTSVDVTRLLTARLLQVGR